MNNSNNEKQLDPETQEKASSGQKSYSIKVTPHIMSPSACDTQFTWIMAKQKLAMEGKLRLEQS